MKLFLLLLAILLLLLTALVWTFRRAFYNGGARREDPYDIPHGRQYQKNRERMLQLIREFDELPYEPVYITSHDGLRLFARYYHVRDGAPLQIQFHGYRGTAMRDFCGGNKIAREAGMNTLVVDQRAHGLSASVRARENVITMGVKERLDCLDWARYAAGRFGPDTPITLAGVSMGAATVLMASDLELPENVKGIIADCGYSSPKAILCKVVSQDMRLPLWAAWPLLKLSARLLGDFDAAAPGAIDSVKHTRVPILLIHGEEDRFVPCRMSRDIAAENPALIRLETFPGAGHGLSYMEDEERYRRVVEEFLRACGGL